MRVRAILKKRQITAKFLTMLSLVLIGLSTLMLNGCASVFSESEYPVRIDSVPSDMEIVIVDQNDDIVFRGRTPALVNLDAHGGYFVRETFTIELYDSGNVVGRKQINGSIDGWYFVNFFTGPGMLIGFFVIDPLTGAMWSLDDRVTVFREVKTTGTDSSSQQQHEDVEDTLETEDNGLIAQKSGKDSAPTSEKTQ
ncbi:MAG: hypothetical protein OXH31_06455 [Gammaproteobacteria bacterium]|nr:hypothetical protein [Gammaproteobacteria bacterium]